jgi:THAP4-like, heme-binding beta-barrel domain
MTDRIESTLAALRPLLGHWEGGGRAEFPTIAPHEYVESLDFITEADRDHIHFEQRARHRPVGTDAYVPSHWESGFLRVTTPGVVEWTNVQDNGRLEVARLALTVTHDGLRLEGETVHFLNDPRMIRARRVLVLSGETLRYQLEMVTTRVETFITHLNAELHRVIRG